MKYNVLIGGYFHNVVFSNKYEAKAYAQRKARIKNEYWGVYDAEGYEVLNGRG